jgi:DNA excision repair protein ERCC-8
MQRYIHILHPQCKSTLSSPVFSSICSSILGGAEHPSIRLLDLRTGGITHTLIGHERGIVVPVRWSPRRSHLLASGGSDGTIRLWDVRRGKACLASLDQHNTATREKGGWLNLTNKAHDGLVNGLEFTADGLNLLSLGHDEKMRVWDLESGMNTLVSFGPVIRNQHRMEVTPYITPPDTCLRPLVYLPSDDGEILCFELYTGQLVSRFRGMERFVNGRVTCVTGRLGHQVWESVRS